MFKRKHAYTQPPLTKPMVAVFRVTVRDGEVYTNRVEYNGAQSYSNPEPIIHGGMVRVGDVWINVYEVLSISVDYNEVA